MSAHERFWLVFKDGHALSDTKRHDSRDSAIAEATRLAKENHGTGFYVAAVTGMALASDVSWTELERNRSCER